MRMQVRNPQSVALVVRGEDAPPSTSMPSPSAKLDDLLAYLYYMAKRKGRGCPWCSIAARF